MFTSIFGYGPGSGTLELRIRIHNTDLNSRLYLFSSLQCTYNVANSYWSPKETYVTKDSPILHIFRGTFVDREQEV
jgi:hypothetical protein